MRGQQDQPLEQGLQLGGVAPPGQRGQKRQRRPRQCLDWHAAPATDLLQEMVREEWNVLAALMERRQLDPDEREAFVEIATQAAFLDDALEAGIDGRNRPDVELDARAIARENRFAITQHAMQLALDARRHLAEVLQEQRAA